MSPSGAHLLRWQSHDQVKWQKGARHDRQQLAESSRRRAQTRCLKPVLQASAATEISSAGRPTPDGRGQSVAVTPGSGRSAPRRQSG